MLPELLLALLCLSGPPSSELLALGEKAQVAADGSLGTPLPLPSIELLQEGDAERFRRLGGKGRYALTSEGRVLLAPPEWLKGVDSTVLERVLRHEWVHARLQQRFRRPLPRWLHEGLARHIAAEWTEDDPSLPSSAAQLTQLEQRLTRPRSAAEELQALVVAERLIQRVPALDWMRVLEAWDAAPASRSLLTVELKGRPLSAWLFASE